MRFGDNFDIPSVSILRSLFYPRIEAVLEVTAELGYEMTDAQDGRNPVATFSCVIHVVNQGRASAKDLYVVAEGNWDRTTWRLTPGQDWVMDQKPDGNLAWAARRSCHPGMVFGPTQIVWSVPTQMVHLVKGRKYLLSEDGKTDIHLKFYGEGQQAQEVRFSFPHDVLVYTQGRQTRQTATTTPLE